MKRARRTFAEVEQDARRHERAETISLLCRIIDHHFGYEELARKLFEEMKKEEPDYLRSANARRIDPRIKPTPAGAWSN